MDEQDIDADGGSGEEECDLGGIGDGLIEEESVLHVLTREFPRILPNFSCKFAWQFPYLDWQKFVKAFCVSIQASCSVCRLFIYNELNTCGNKINKQ